jgi:hypothetical protein
MNIPDHTSESLETIFWFFDTDPDSGSRIFLTLDPGSRIQYKNPGCATLFFEDNVSGQHFREMSFVPHRNCYTVVYVYVALPVGSFVQIFLQNQI